ncbi:MULTISPECIES: hypothetical protein [Achromobacter]|uniref:hypothetical protein n=1 Tax=Achromobacter TaxID=222 RepID=UPI000AA02336|nr:MULTISPECIES: hypothetical protein [Achromobacter]WPQ34359.1 hypothetical protein SLH34_27715 [Achromobacter xylosoxidans]
MSDDDFDAFMALLDDVAALRQLPVLSDRAKLLFFDAVRRYPLHIVEKAIQAHLIDPVEGRFKTMVQPAHIVAQIEGAAANDGRPDADEAWAIAMRADDEAVTVVWTDEISQALTAARPVLARGDEVGARMAFKAAYGRLLTQARKELRPVRWVASLGHDLAQREAVLQHAVDLGQLPAPHVAGLLPPPGAEFGAPDDEVAAENIRKLHQMLAKAITPSEKRRRAAEEASLAERNRLDALKAQTAAKVAQHQQGARA